MKGRSDSSQVLIRTLSLGPDNSALQKKGGERERQREVGTEMPGAGGVRVGRSESRLDGPQSRQDAPVCLLG